MWRPMPPHPSTACVRSRNLAARGQHRLVTVPAGAEPALRPDLLPAAGHLDRAWPGIGREPSQQVAGERMSASPGAHHRNFCCPAAQPMRPPLRRLLDQAYTSGVPGLGRHSSNSPRRPPGRVGRTQVHAVASAPSVSFRPGASWPLSRLPGASATLVTVSPPALPPAAGSSRRKHRTVAVASAIARIAAPAHAS